MNGGKPNVFSVAAPAKLNLHLEILGRRGDGYHDLRSVFLMIDLCDRLNISVGAKRDGCEVSGDGAVDPGHNTVTKALAIFRRETGRPGPMHVTLEKKIPTGSGLGGGSSDGASLLRFLNATNGRPLSQDRLCALGAEIGSDVPFFLTAPCAVVEGRGERVKACSGPGDLAIAVIVPDFSVATAAAYRWLDDEIGARQPPEPQVVELEGAWQRRSPAQWGFFNSFFEVIRRQFPDYDELQQTLSGAGAVFQGLSGSGSAYFAIFADEAAAAAALSTVKGNFRFKALVRPLIRLPDTVGDPPGATTP